MFKKIGLTGLLLGSVLMTQTASAALIIDPVDVNHKIGYLSNYSYIHDINPYGFTPGTALSASLAIQIYDDNECTAFECVVEWIPEVMLITVEDFDFDTGGITFGNFFSSLEVEALAALNSDGRLDVTVKSLSGDFWVGTSTLTVDINSPNSTPPSADVPEPGTTALMGAGLLGLLLSRRRKTT